MKPEPKVLSSFWRRPSCVNFWLCLLMNSSTFSGVMALIWSRVIPFT